MRNPKQGIPKKRLPQGLEGLCRLGTVKTIYNNNFYVNTRYKGLYRFDTSDSKIFNQPLPNEKVIISFLGEGKNLLFPYKVSDREGKKIYYEKI